jgi:hypothetical protein
MLNIVQKGVIPSGVILFLMLVSWSQVPQGFNSAFSGKTLRFDYYHSGTAGREEISVDQFRLEGEWPGSRKHLVDDTNLGKFLFQLIDVASNRVIYSRGFCSIYGEWETTAEAVQGIWRTYHESQRFPEPRMSCQLVLKKRGADGTFREIFTTTIDPVSRFVDRSPLVPRGQVWEIFENGPPEKKLDLLILGDGYTQEEMGKFRSDVKRLVSVLFETEPFHSRENDFNVRAIDLASQESGISNPRSGVWRNSALGLSFNAFDSDRYVLSFHNKTIREVAALAPYDTMVMLFNDRKYGGGGIFNLWATCSSDTQVAPYVFVHELGHTVAGLADEYYTSDVAYEDFNAPGTEPWEPNITALLDGAEVKWKDQAKASTPIPTPWNQEVYDKLSHEYQEKRRKLRNEGASEEAIEQLFEDIKQKTTPMLGAEKYAGMIGAFEGAGYQAKGLFRPAVDCIMFSRNPKSFCRVCEMALTRVINMYAE